MATNYKDLREELNELLQAMNVPRNYWYQSSKLWQYIATHFHLFKPNYAERAVEIISILYPHAEGEKNGVSV
jgi:hypothetical protein